LHDERDATAPQADDGKTLRHSWSPAPPPEWETLITELGL